jgi:glutaredoxin
MQFVEHDVQGDNTALERRLLLNGGQRHVPTIVMGGEVTVGFHGT